MRLQSHVTQGLKREPLTFLARSKHNFARPRRQQHRSNKDHCGLMLQVPFHLENTTWVMLNVWGDKYCFGVHFRTNYRVLRSLALSKGFDEDILGKSLGWLDVTAATYCPDRPVQLAWKDETKRCDRVDLDLLSHSLHEKIQYQQFIFLEIAPSEATVLVSVLHPLVEMGTAAACAPGNECNPAGLRVALACLEQKHVSQGE